MALHLISVSGRQPAWLEEGLKEYATRLPKPYDLHLHTCPLSQRTKNSVRDKLIEQESNALLQAAPKQGLIIALEPSGKLLDSPGLASQLESWMQLTSNLSFIIGGPDGLSAAALSKAHFKWSLSPLIMPHGLVKLLVAEQLYRAWTILQGHPYHQGH